MVRSGLGSLSWVFVLAHVLISCGDDGSKSGGNAAPDAAVAADASVDPGPPPEGIQTCPGETTGTPVPINMINVPAGTFKMGCTPGVGSCSSVESPPHDLNMHAFSIDVTEVTQQAYQACMDAGACTPPMGTYDPAQFPLHPVTNVDWRQANAYCAWVDKRLPTEA
jgi:formylglycine-generating enzyme required for sulfatase activity